MQVTKKVFRLTPVFLSLALSLSTACADNLATKTTASTGTSSSTSSTSPAPSSTVSTGSIVGATVGGTVVAGGAIGGGVALNKAIDSGLVEGLSNKLKSVFSKNGGNTPSSDSSGVTGATDDADSIWPMDDALEVVSPAALPGNIGTTDPPDTTLDEFLDVINSI
jgi:hypothetical protein